MTNDLYTFEEALLASAEATDRRGGAAIDAVRAKSVHFFRKAGLTDEQIASLMKLPLNKIHRL